MVRVFPILAFIFASTIAASAARAESAASARHEAWRTCLSDAFALRAALSNRVPAADAALRECRDSESAYLAALSMSPLIDGDDVARVRPALLVRARSWLLSVRPSRSL